MARHELLIKIPRSLFTYFTGGEKFWTKSGGREKKKKKCLVGSRYRKVWRRLIRFYSQRKEWRTETNVTRLTNGELFGADDRKPFQIDKSIKPHIRSSTSLSLSLSLPLPSSIHFAVSIEERTYQFTSKYSFLKYNKIGIENESHRFEVKMKKEREREGGGGKYHLVSTNFVQSTLQATVLICDEILNLKKRGNKWC